MQLKIFQDQRKLKTLTEFTPITVKPFEMVILFVFVTKLTFLIQLAQVLTLIEVNQTTSQNYCDTAVMYVCWHQHQVYTAGRASRLGQQWGPERPPIFPPLSSTSRSSLPSLGSRI